MIHKILGGIGFVLLMIGAAAMDSEQVIIPVIILFTGLGLLVWTAGEKNYLWKGGKKG